MSRMKSMNISKRYSTRPSRTIVCFWMILSSVVLAKIVQMPMQSLPKASASIQLVKISRNRSHRRLPSSHRHRKRLSIQRRSQQNTWIYTVRMGRWTMLCCWRDGICAIVRQPNTNWSTIAFNAVELCANKREAAHACSAAIWCAPKTSTNWLNRRRRRAIIWRSHCSNCNGRKVGKKRWPCEIDWLTTIEQAKNVRRSSTTNRIISKRIRFGCRTLSALNSRNSKRSWMRKSTRVVVRRKWPSILLGDK